MMIDNSDIFKRYLKKDEVLLWNQKPHAKRHPIIDNIISRHLLAISIAIIVSFPFFWIIANILIILMIAFLFYLVIFGIIIMKISSSDRIVLLDSEYFITNKQVFAIIFDKGFFNLIKYGALEVKKLVNVPFSHIEYFFYRQTKQNRSLFDVYVKVKFDSLEEWKDTILICKEMRDIMLNQNQPISIEHDNRWRATRLESIERLKNVQNIEKIKELLINQLGIEFRDPPENLEKKFRGGNLHITN